MGKAETNRSRSPVGNIPPSAKALAIQNSPVYNITPQIAVKFISLWSKAILNLGIPLIGTETVLKNYFCQLSLEVMLFSKF